MIIKGAKVFDENCKFANKDVYINDDKISNSSNNQDIIDATGLYAIPGLIDTHFHGAVGADFCDGTTDSIKKIAEYQALNGVTALCPATLTLPTEELTEICRVATEYSPSDIQSDLIGIHLEGPFVSVDKIGAQNPKYVKVPDIDSFNKWYDASKRLVKMISLAPETPGAIEFITEVSKKAICSIAHTTADYDTTTKALNAGANHVTHLYNAMPGFHHREPSVIGAAFDKKDCFVEIITDNVHLHPAVVRATLQLFGNDRVVFVSDSMMATGLTDGDYSLGGLDVKVVGNMATLKNGAIAGSATNLMNCVKTAVKDMNIPLETAIKCASVNPAKMLDMYSEYGNLNEGSYANITLLDNELNVKYVILRGNVILNNSLQ